MYNVHVNFLLLHLLQTVVAVVLVTSPLPLPQKLLTTMEGPPLLEMAVLEAPGMMMQSYPLVAEAVP